MPWPRTYAVEKYTPRTWRMVSLAAVVWITLTLCAWWVSHGWGIFCGIAGFHFLLLGFLTGKPRRRYLEWTTLLVAVAIIGYACFYPCINYIWPENRDASVRYLSSDIASAAQDYAETHGGHYPVLPEQLFGGDAPLEELPHNPYGSLKTLYLQFSEGEGWPVDAPADAVARNIITGGYITQAELDAMGIMHHVSMSDPEHAGNFTYIPHLERDASGEVVCTGFTLVGYGLAMYGHDNYREHLYGGNAWEHVVYVSGNRGD